MTEFAATVLASLDKLLHILESWKEGVAERELDRERRFKAIGQIRGAALATQAYIHDRDAHDGFDRAREAELSQIWREAGEAIRKYDRNLWEVSKIKALGWADPRGWERAGDRIEAIQLTIIAEQCEWLEQNER